MEDAEKRIQELEARVARLEKDKALLVATDDALEIALRDRLPLGPAMQALMPLLVEATGASALFVRTYDESLRLSDFTVGEMPIDGDELADGVGEGPLRRDAGQHLVLAQRIDVAGEDFGVAAIAVPAERGDQEASDLASLMDTWCEVLDNYLASIARAREKHQITCDLSDALRRPVLDDGIQRALAVLRDAVPFDDMLLVFRHEDDHAGVSLRYKIIQDGQLTHDSVHPADMEVDDFIRNKADQLITGESRDLLVRFGITRCREEVLISGVSDARVLGRVVITSKRGEFNTFDRDLVERFADYLRQRIVDFNREWKHLSLCFPPRVVQRLLHQEGYRKRYLEPRERDVAVLYCDISGFTRVSEQILGEPALIGELIDRWSEAVVDIVWDTGGVFDKMVGDCVIGLWGPPFFEDEPKALCRSAAEAARRIRDYTATLNDGVLMPKLRGMEPPIGVATGVHFAPLFVGLFGPNEDFTGFSSGMNNTARLQGVATRDEILCMDAFVEAYEEPAAFGDAREAKVKNVEHPLQFRPLT